MSPLEGTQWRLLENLRERLRRELKEKRELREQRGKQSEVNNNPPA